MPNPKFTPSEIRAAREACERATEAERWRHKGFGFGVGFCHGFQDDASPEQLDSGIYNAEFCALARTALPAALDEIERLKKLLAEACDRWESLWQSETATASDPESPSRLAELRKESSDV